MASDYLRLMRQLADVVNLEEVWSVMTFEGVRRTEDGRTYLVRIDVKESQDGDFTVTAKRLDEIEQPLGESTSNEFGTLSDAARGVHWMELDRAGE